MTDEALANSDEFGSYVEALRPLFEPDQHLRSDRLFEYVCCLLRVGGIERDSDPILESAALLEDLKKLSTEQLDPTTFRNPERTRARLALLSYCHITEADFFYKTLACLAKLCAGQKYDIDPFFDLWRARRRGRIPPVLSEKIGRVNELASKVGVNTAPLFEQIYFKDIRNAVFHADYALTDTDLVMRHGLFKVKDGYLQTPAVPLDELDAVIQRSFAFYSAIMELHYWARSTLIELKNRILPFDPDYKGLLELLFEDDLLSGFRAYWPNGSNSEFTRTRAGCSAVNITFAKDRGIDFMVGMYASNRGSFSPLVEHDAKPLYTPARGRQTAPYWPEDLKPYEAR